MAIAFLFKACKDGYHRRCKKTIDDDSDSWYDELHLCVCECHDDKHKKRIKEMQLPDDTKWAYEHQGKTNWMSIGEYTD